MNTYYQKIYSILSPVVGEIVASSTMHLHIKKLNITEDSINSTNIRQLTENISQSINLFTEPSRASEIKIKLQNIH